MHLDGLVIICDCDIKIKIAKAAISMAYEAKQGMK